MRLKPASVCPCVCSFVCLFTLSNMSISDTSVPIASKFYLIHHLGRGKTAQGFGPDRIGSGFHGNRNKVKMGNILLAL